MQFVYPTDGEHRSGKELVMDFDVVAFVTTLLAMNAWSQADTTDDGPPVPAEDMELLIYDRFQLSYHDVVEAPADISLTCLKQHKKYWTNDVVMGCMKKLSCKCANPDCEEDFMNVAPNSSNGNHWDHEVSLNTIVT